MSGRSAGQSPDESTRQDHDDPVVDEVRAVRRQMLDEAGGDIGRMLDLAAEQSAEFRRAAQQRRREQSGEAA